MPVKRTTKKAASKPAKFNPEDYAADAEQFLALERQIKEFETRKAEIRQRIVDQVEQFGEEDDNGHIFLDLPETVRETVGFKWEKRVSRNLDADVAEPLLEKRDLLKDCQTTITVLDESKIEALFFEEKIRKADYDKMFPVREARALRQVKI